jgi:adenosylcobinamide kinase/adenosylcobinamide-phosphate guanylyltransferase
MAKIVLVVGGSRSGKSDYAQELAEAGTCERYYLATCPPPQGDDPEMAARVAAHQRRRQDRGWQMREEAVDLASLVQILPGGATLLIDCLSLWLSNLLYADADGRLDEVRVAVLAAELLAAGRAREGQLIMVANEVGCGLVPELALARRFRDLAGRCNQVMAAGADQVVQVVCGIPVIIKG